MDKMDRAKKEHEDIEIPEELHEMVNETIKKFSINHYMEEKRRMRNMKRILHTKRIGGTAVAVLAVFFVGLNTSSAFAAGAKNIPVIGSIANVLTIRSYEESDADKKLEVSIPGVSIKEATVEEKGFTDEINAEIQKKCDEYIKGAVERVEEYKEGFIATGGTEEEFEQKAIVISVGYEIKNKTDDTLSFVISGTESWVSAYAITDYYNLNTKTLKTISLEDVLGENYIDIANESIKQQMEKQMAEDENIIYWSKDDGGFTTITDETNFYINSDGKAVVVFDKYEVGPGAMGQAEFVID